MLIKDMFEKDINRNIRGVVKVDQINEDDIYRELDEYVVTKELKKHFSKFYEDYVKSIGTPTDKMGGWISGFFGSGKSHFLKILSYLLANDPVKGQYPVELFESKVKDPMLFALMEKAASVDTNTILFNIDQKSSTSYTEDDAILRVFKKVFDEHRGYYGDNAGIAKMEKFLDDNGHYDLFKENYEKTANEPWVGNQNNFYFRGEAIIEAIIQSSNMSGEYVKNWFENVDNTADLSIESFADEVKEYVNSKNDDFHLVFLVDEIGQYIGDNRKLMLNLQTVVELLGARCHGKVWVLVTSQESIDSIIKVKGSDFSRIQGRFDTRLSLSSTSADEVIKKRILDKKDYVSERLQAVYPEQGPILTNLISFRNATGNLRSYDGALEFSQDYPFIPYQFKLLQNIFEQVRKHGSSGKHLSEGERSMLSAFQEAALQYGEDKEGILVPLHAFYNTISEFLNPSITRVINGASSNPNLSDYEFNNQLLKILFMIKYIEEIPGNIDNLATLMVTHVNEDKTLLKENIKNALVKLRQERLIQKNGENYLFLTDEEQDVNREIQNINVDESRLIRVMSEYIFDDIYSDKTYRYSDQYSFPFNQQLDTVNYRTSTAELNVKVITAQSFDYKAAEQDLMVCSMNGPDLIIRLGAEGNYVEELEEALKIEAYSNRTNTKQLSETKQNIINVKKSEIRERRSRAIDFLEEAIRDAEFYVNGAQIKVTGNTAKNKINSGLEYLVNNTYTKLVLINDHISNERELKNKLDTQEASFKLEETEDTTPNLRAKEAIESYIRMLEGKQITVKTIYDQFKFAPYGWKELDIAGLLIDLLKDEKIRIRYNAEYLTIQDASSELEGVFTNSSMSSKTIVVKREKVDAGLIRKVKLIVRDLFDQTNLSDDEDGLMQEIHTLIEDKQDEIKKYKQNYVNDRYPGESLLEKGLEYFSEFSIRLDAIAYFKKIVDMENDLLNWDEDFSTIEDFFNSNQKVLYDNGKLALETYEANKNYLFQDELQQCMERLKDIILKPIPYREIKDIPELTAIFYRTFESTLSEMKEQTKANVELDLENLQSYAEHEGISKSTKSTINQTWEDFASELRETKDIYKVDSITNQSERTKSVYERQIRQEIKAYNESLNPNTVEETDPVIEPTEEKVDLSRIVLTTTLTSEADVDAYVNEISSKLKSIIKENKTIRIK